MDAKTALQEREAQWLSLSLKSANGQLLCPTDIQAFIVLRQQRSRAGKPGWKY